MRLRDPNLEQTFDSLREMDKRAAAELAYALGMIYRKAGDYQRMRKYREESISLFKEVGINTLEEACPIYESINGIMMPSLIHEGVVARDLTEPK